MFINFLKVIKIKKLILIFLLSSITFAQQEANGELRIELINRGSSWNVSIKLTAIVARWDANYDLTEDYETVSSSASNPDFYIDFEHILDPGVEPEFAIGLYKISAIENGVEQAYFYMDWRTSNWIWSQDVTFKYDVGNKRFRDKDDTQTIDYSYQTLWDLTPNLLETSGLEDYWANCLSVVNNGNNNPRMVWGPHPTFQATYYKVFRAVSATPLNKPELFASVIATVSSSTYEHTDFDISLNGNSYIYYFVRGYNGSYSARTNIVEVRGGFYKENISGEDDQKLKFNLNQNYPNPFNPTTQIDYSITKAGLVTLKVYDILGNEVAILVNERREPGYYLTTLDAANLPSGIYFYQLRTENFTDTKKMILLR